MAHGPVQINLQVVTEAILQFTGIMKKMVSLMADLDATLRAEQERQRRATMAQVTRWTWRVVWGVVSGYLVVGGIL